MSYDEKEKDITQIAYRGYSSQSLLKISANIEYTSFSNDVIFLEVCQGVKQAGGGFKYDTGNPISMLFNAIELRALAYAMKEILKTKDTTAYEKFTKSDGALKKLTVGYATKEKRVQGEVKIIEEFFINAFNAKTSVNIGVPFTKYDFISFSDSLNLIAQELELFLYKHQRMKRRN